MGGTIKPGMIEIRSYMMGQDVTFLVTGGKAHIGAVATAYRSGNGVVLGGVLSLPGHREGELAADLAMTACRRLDQTVAVQAGIHLDQASKQEIEFVVAETKRKMNLVLEQWND